jgi:DNA-binding response OmpR family regulator
MKVLVVECNKQEQIRLKEIITKLEGSIAVKQAYSYKDALKIMQLFWPDTVLLNAILYDGSSLMLLEILKALNPKVKVIVMAISPTIQFKKICLESGADDFFELSNIDILMRCIA